MGERDGQQQERGVGTALALIAYYNNDRYWPSLVSLDRVKSLVVDQNLARKRRYVG